MNCYERIQQSIDYIELHLADELSVDEAAKQAYMSMSNYYRMFYSITGYTVKRIHSAPAAFLCGSSLA